MSRERILQDLRRASGPASELPASDGKWTTYADPTQQFAAALAAAGGGCVEVAPHGLQAAIDAVAVSVEAQRVVSFVSPTVTEANQARHPREYDGVDLAICVGSFGVAENGAVWIPRAAVPEQSVLFLTQHLVLTLARRQIVHNMHEAYDRLSFDEPGFGTFISGPSKTADIEQSLVIGAHGPRSLTVLLLTSEP